MCLMIQGVEVILGGKKNMFSEYFSFPVVYCHTHLAFFPILSPVSKSVSLIDFFP